MEEEIERREERENRRSEKVVETAKWCVTEGSRGMAKVHCNCLPIPTHSE